jgi:hypothetical protein
VCGAYLRQDALEHSAALTMAYVTRGCADGLPCPGCAPQLVAGCNAGTCGFRLQPGAVGDACMSSGQCESIGSFTGSCLTGLPDGYCVLPCAPMFSCADEKRQVCRSVAPNGNATACFAVCATDADCRTAEGYRCCPPWNEFGSGAFACYPGPCP